MHSCTEEVMYPSFIYIRTFHHYLEKGTGIKTWRRNIIVTTLSGMAVTTAFVSQLIGLRFK
uniref:Uncharacterized protein n=2 Tax=Solanum TaxID=4107 RepID=M1BWD4_SOLTU